MESAEKPTQDLHSKVSHNLNKAGHRVTPADLNPAPDVSLENIRDILGKTTVHLVNIPIEESLSGREETVSGSKVVSFVREKIRRLRTA